MESLSRVDAQDRDPWILRIVEELANRRKMSVKAVCICALFLWIIPAELLVLLPL